MVLTETQGDKKLRDVLSLSSIYYAGYKSTGAQEAKFEFGQCIVMLYAEKGGFSLQYRGVSLEVKENCFAFIPPTSACLFSATVKTRVFVCAFSLNSKIPLDIFDRPFFASGIKVPLLKRLTRSSLKTFPLGSTSQKSEKSDPIDEHLIKHCIELLVLDSLKPANKSIIDSNYPISGKGESARVATCVYEYLTKNVNKTITLEEIADELFFSVSYVKTAFKKHTGKSVMRAFAELKIKRAKKLIKNGMHFAEIAKELSYSSEQYFSRAFKSIAGMTPMEYKKTLIK